MTFTSFMIKYTDVWVLFDICQVWGSVCKMRKEEKLISSTRGGTRTRTAAMATGF